MFGGNMAKMMQKAQELQKNMQLAKSEVEKLVITTKSGEVQITIDGNYKVIDIQIGDSVIDDKEALIDMLTLAINDGTSQIKLESEKIMQNASGGMKLPF